MVEAQMQRKGVCYDVGREMLGQNWRPEFDPTVVRRELEIIHRDLHCTSVRIQGFDLGRLTTASEFALAEGLEVWFSPEMWDHTAEEMLPYLGRAGEVAERLRHDHGDRLVISVGSEISLFSQGFLPGHNVLERLANPKFRETVKSGQHNASLNAFLNAACRTVRATFRGPLTYASLGFEAVDWGPFDFVGADLYRDGRFYAQYPEIVRRYVGLGKPLANLEFGCCTFRGAEQLGGRGWQVVDWSTIPPRLTGDYIYDQGAQAREIADLLRVNDEAGVDATFVFTFVEPGAGLDAKQRRGLSEVTFDLDLPRYSLVKTILDGRHGTTYPEMPWEPKESFRAVADYYASH
jgi:hypothetical protein